MRQAVPAMFALVILACALMGLAVGSFLNVVVYRVPLGLSVVRPGSACPGCATLLAARDNIPLVSWLALRGRCRTCQAPISPRYPVIEALTAVLFVGTAIRLGVSWSLPVELFFVAGSVALAAVDLERYLLPKKILYPTLGLVSAAALVAAAATGRWSHLLVAAACGLGAFAAFFVVHSVRPAWLGFGDVRLAALLGLALGWLGPWYLLIGMMAANVLGSVIGVGLIMAGRTKRSTALPYGVFLTAGAVVALFVGAPLISWYSHAVIG